MELKLFDCSNDTRTWWMSASPLSKAYPYDSTNVKSGWRTVVSLKCCRASVLIFPKACVCFWEVGVEDLHSLKPFSMERFNVLKDKSSRVCFVETFLIRANENENWTRQDCLSLNVYEEWLLGKDGSWEKKNKREMTRKRNARERKRLEFLLLKRSSFAVLLSRGNRYHFRKYGAASSTCENPR